MHKLDQLPLLSQTIDIDNSVLQSNIFDSFITDLSPSSVIMVKGEDAASFLQGQLSNDINLVTEQLSQLSACCNPKGRVLAIFRIFKYQDQLCLVVANDIKERIIKRLKMFVMMSKVEIIDMSDEITHFGLAGEKIDSILRECNYKVDTTENSVSFIKGISFISLPGPGNRFECFASFEAVKQLTFALNENSSPKLSHYPKQIWNILGIKAGLANISSNTQELFVPQMLNLHSIDAVSFKKGCYTGQEVVARMHHLGTAKRLMYGIKFHSSLQVKQGDSLYSPDSKSAQGAGKIVNIEQVEHQQYIALAVIENELISHNSIYIDEPQQHKVEIFTLPYQQKNNE